MVVWNKREPQVLNILDWLFNSEYGTLIVPSLSIWFFLHQNSTTCNNQKLSKYEMSLCDSVKWKMWHEEDFECIIKPTEIHWVSVGIFRYSVKYTWQWVEQMNGSKMNGSKMNGSIMNGSKMNRTKWIMNEIIRWSLPKCDVGIETELFKK
jgi:hypothetical protein